MKKSTNESPAATPLSSPQNSPEKAQSKANVYRPPVIWEIVSTEGGFSLVIIYPLVVLYFLKMAYSSFG